MTDDALGLLRVDHERTIVYVGRDIVGEVWLYATGWRAEGARAEGPMRRTLDEALADLEAMTDHEIRRAATRAVDAG